MGSAAKAAKVAKAKGTITERIKKSVAPTDRKARSAKSEVLTLRSCFSFTRVLSRPVLLASRRARHFARHLIEVVAQEGAKRFWRIDVHPVPRVWQDMVGDSPALLRSFCLGTVMRTPAPSTPSGKKLHTRLV